MISQHITMKNIIRTFWSSSGILYRLARIMLMSIIAVVILLMAFEDKLIYFPTRYPDGFWTVTETCYRQGEIIPMVEDCNFVSSDGVSLHGWYCSPLRCENGTGVPVTTERVLLWFHGNAGNISYRYDMMRAMMGIPVEVFLVDYRGYGKSEGKPSEKGLYLDARAAWEYLINERGVRPDQIIIFGKSLGGVPAIDLASNVKPAGLIVQSSFTSAGDMAAELLPFLPRLFLHTEMDSVGKISRVGCPKLFIHSRADEVVPYRLGRKLFELAPDPKVFYEVVGAPHNSTYLVGGKAYFDTLRRFIQTCRVVKTDE